MPKWALVALAAAALGAWGLKRAWEGARPPRTPLDLPLAAWLLCLTLGTALSGDRAQSLLGLYTNYVNGWTASAQLAALFLAAAWALDAASARRLVAWAVAGGALAGLYGTLQYLGLEPFAGVQSRAREQAFATLGNPVFLGAAMMALLPPALRLAEAERGARRALAGAAVLLLAAGLLSSAARAAWVGAALSLGLYAWWGRPFGLSRRALAGLAAAGLVAGGLALAVFPPAQNVSRRLRSFFDPAERSNSARVEVYKGALALFAERPWLGSGPDTFKDSFRRVKSEAFVRASWGSEIPYQAHGDLLQALATLGLLGAGIYLWGAAALARAGAGALARGPDRGLAAALCASLAGLFAQRNLNASALSVAALGAVLAGALAALGREGSRDGAWPLPARLSRGLSLGAAALACALALLVARLAWADHHRLLASAGRRLPEASLRHHAESVRLNPWNPRYRSHYAAALETFAGRDPDPARRRLFVSEALRVTEEGARRHPRDAEMRHQRAVALFWAGGLGLVPGFSEARAEIEAALDLDPTDPEIWANRARIARLAGDPAERRHWERVLELKPGHPAALEVLSRTGSRL